MAQTERGDKVVLLYNKLYRRKAESLRTFFESMGLVVEMIESTEVSEVNIKYNGIRWGDPDDAIRHIVGQFIKKGLI